MISSSKSDVRLLDIFQGHAAQSDSKREETLSPFSIRFTSKERELLRRWAKGQPLGTFIRTKLFDDEVTHRQRGRKPVYDHAAIGKALGALGQSRLASNMNQLAKAANIGTLPVTPKVVDELQAACADIREMRRALISALGIAVED